MFASPLLLNTEFSFKNVPWKFAFLAVAITTLTFISSLQNNFIDTWDDEGYVINNSQLSELSFKKVKEIFSNDLLGNYNPLTILTFAVEKHFFGLNPFFYHLDNLILHLACTLLVFWFSWLLFPSITTAFIVSLLFGIHPLHVESVAWVTERKDVLFGVFYLASMIAYLYYVKSMKTGFLMLCYFLFVFSLFSKIQAVALPLSLLCIDYFLQRPINRKAILEKIPMFAISILFGLVGIYFLHEMKAFFVSSDISFFQRPFIGTYALSVYLLKSLLPFKLAAFYPYPNKEDTFLFMTVYSSILLIPFLLFLLRKFFYTNRVLVFGLLFFIFNIVFLLQVVEAGGAFLADRFSYISFTGLFFIYGFYFEKWIGKNPQLKIILWTVAACYFAVLAFTSWNRTKVWKDNLIFWNDEVEKFPRVTISYTNRAGVFIKQNKLNEAKMDLTTYTALRPANPEGYYKLGLVDEAMKNYEIAIKDFTAALHLNPNYTNALLHRANIYTATKQLAQALGDCEKMLLLNPLNPDAWNLRGNIHFTQGLFSEALKDINRTIELDSNFKDGYRNRAILYDMLGEHQKALDDFDRHLKLFPDDAAAMGWRKNVAVKMGRQ